MMKRIQVQLMLVLFVLALVSGCDQPGESNNLHRELKNIQSDHTKELHIKDEQYERLRAGYESEIAEKDQQIRELKKSLEETETYKSTINVQRLFLWLIPVYVLIGAFFGTFMGIKGRQDAKKNEGADRETV